MWKETPVAQLEADLVSWTRYEAQTFTPRLNTLCLLFINDTFVLENSLPQKELPRNRNSISGRFIRFDVSSFAVKPALGPTESIRG
jgi:hypothetical protein